MDLKNDFEVAVPLDEAWAVLTDIEKIAPCVPGAQLTEVTDDDYHGTVKVKVGPMTASYRGVVRFIELDEVGHIAVLKAEGVDTRGQGDASATVTASLSPSASGTRVEVVTDLTITGKVAQFGRSVITEVSAKVLGQFAQNLQATVLAPAATAAAATGSGPATGEPHRSEPAAAATNGTRANMRHIDSAEAQPIDLMSVAGGSLAKRVLPIAGVAGGLLLFGIVIYLVRRRTTVTLPMKEDR